MKRILPIIGLLLVAPLAHASCPGDGAAEILQLTPVSSHYTQQVLERADRGIQFAESSSSKPFDFMVLLLPWLDEVLDASMQLVDTEVQIVEEERSLRQHTPCLFVDVALIEAKMEEVRCKLSNETMDIDEGGGEINPGKIARLRALLLFLNERKHQLLLGATNPHHEDYGWQQRQLFDDPTDVWCAIMYGSEEENNTCELMTEEKCWGAGGGAAFDSESECWATFLGRSRGEPDDPTNTSMCPFHSNYLPPTIYGLGCDASVLNSYSSNDLVKPEIDGLNTIVNARGTLKEKVQSIIDVWSDIAELLGEELPEGWGEIADLPEYEHQDYKGCYETIVQEIENTTDVELASEEGQLRRNLIYILGGTRWALRGPFSMEKDDTKLMREFAQMRTRWGGAREQADELKLPLEFDTEDEQDAAKRKASGISISQRIGQQVGRPYFTRFNSQQAVEEASIVAKANDNQLALSKALQRLRNENRKLAELAIAKDKGARNFARKLATLLRVSCIYRPCNMQLTNILKLALEDTCFPFSKKLDVELAEGQQSEERSLKTPDEQCKENAELSCVLPNGDEGIQKAKDGRTWNFSDGNWSLGNQGTTVFKCEKE